MRIIKTIAMGNRAVSAEVEYTPDEFAQNENLPYLAGVLIKQMLDDDSQAAVPRNVKDPNPHKGPAPVANFRRPPPEDDKD